MLFMYVCVCVCVHACTYTNIPFVPANICIVCAPETPEADARAASDEHVLIMCECISCMNVYHM